MRLVTIPASSSRVAARLNLGLVHVHARVDFPHRDLGLLAQMRHDAPLGTAQAEPLLVDGGKTRGSNRPARTATR